jgi:hypothetical protein
MGFKNKPRSCVLYIGRYPRRLPPMLHFVVFFVAVTIIVIFLATKQRKPLDRHCLTAVALLCVLAATSVVLLQGTNLFPASAFALAALLLVHRSIVHFPDELDEEVTPGILLGCVKRGKEVSNHGTWVIATSVAGAVSAFGW